MESLSIERKLTTILHADVAGYSRLMGIDEVGTLRTLTAHRHLTDALIHQHHGRVVGSAGTASWPNLPAWWKPYNARSKSSRH